MNILKKRKHLIMASLMFGATALQAAAFVESFESDPTGGAVVTSFSKTYDSVQFDFIGTAEGDGANLRYDTAGNGESGTNSIKLTSANITAGKTETVIIKRHDGQDFRATSLYINNESPNHMTVVGYRNNVQVSALQGVLSGSSRTHPLGDFRIDEIRITGQDIYNTYIDSLVVSHTNAAPTVQSTAITAATQDLTYAYELNANDPEGDLVTWSVTEGSTLPTWLSLKTVFSKTTLLADGFSGASSITVDKNDVLYVADTNNKKIKKITSDGSVYSISDLYYPRGIAVDSKGILYITRASSDNIYKMDTNGANASFHVINNLPFPRGLTVDAKDTLYVANSTPSVIYKVNGYDNLTTWTNQVQYPSYIVVDSKGVIYACESGQSVKKVTPDGTATPFATGFQNIYGLAVDADDNVYVLDAPAGLIEKIDPNGIRTTVATGLDGPLFIAVDSIGNLYTTAKSGNEIVKLPITDTITTLSGTPTNADVGIHNISLTLTDESGATVEHNFQITVANVNDAPTSADVTFSIDEDTYKIFSVNDFTFNDVDANSLFSNLIFTTLPTAGTLTLNGSNVTPNLKIAERFIPYLRYTPEANANGAPYTSFEFKVQDQFAASSLAHTVTINVNDVNDSLTIANIENITTVEDDGDINITLSQTDVDGDMIIYLVASSDPTVATVAVVDGKLIVTALPDANGVVTIEVNATADGQTVSQSFDVTITAVNDPVIITNSVSDIIVYKNFNERNINLGVVDADGDTLTYTLRYDETLANISVSNSQMFINSIEGVSGATDINLTVADAETNATLNFTLHILSFEDGDNIEEQGQVSITEVSGTKTFTVTVPQDNLTVEMVEHNNATVSHRVVLSGKETSAVSNLANAIVELVSNGVRTRYEEDLNAMVEVIATVLGQAIHRVTVDGKVTEALFESPGTTTVIDRDDNGNIEVVSSFNTAESKITVIARADGSAEQIVSRNGNSSSVIASVKGTKTVVKANSDMEMIAGAYDDLNGYFIKVNVLTKADGQSELKFIKVNQADETDVSDLFYMVSSNTPLPAGSEVTVYKLGSTLYIQAKIKLDNNLVIE